MDSNGARWADVDDDGLVEILASSGPAASQTDVYGWDGEAYVYRDPPERQRGLGARDRGGGDLDLQAVRVQVANLDQPGAQGGDLARSKSELLIENALSISTQIAPGLRFSTDWADSAC